MPSQEVIDKAARLLRENRVSLEDATAYEVVGDHATYTVIIHHDQSYFCSCDAHRAGHTCSHTIATLKFHRDRIDQAKNLLGNKATRERARKRARRRRGKN